MRTIDKKTCFSILIISFFTFFVISCAQKQIDIPASKEPDLEKKILQEQVDKAKLYQIAKEEQRLKLIEILKEEALKYVLIEQYKEGIVTYNLILSQTVDIERQEIYTLVEEVLIKTPPEVIEELLGIQNLEIPESMILYWLGLNYALNKNYEKAKTVLIEFLEKYPNHYYKEDVSELMVLLKEATFKKNTIGCILPLTGKYSIFGKKALTGIQLAVDDLSKMYSQEFKVIIKDNQSDSKISGNCVQELYEMKVAGIVGPLIKIDEAGQKAQQLGMPMIAMTQKSDFALKGDSLFSNFITPKMQVWSLVSYSIMELGIKKFAILYPDEPYGKKYMNLFWDALEYFEGQVVGVEKYDTSKTDFSESIQKITGEFYPLPDFLKPEEDLTVQINNEYNDFKNFNLEFGSSSRNDKDKEEEPIEIDFDAIFIPDSPSRLKLILPQLPYNDVTDVYLLGNNLWHNPSLLTDVKGYNKKCIITDGYLIDSSNRLSSEFGVKYQTLFDSEPGYIAAISYDSAAILLSRAIHPDIDSRKSMKASLLSNEIYDGVTGKIIFDSDGNAYKDLFLMTIKTGKFVEISH